MLNNSITVADSMEPTIQENKGKISQHSQQRPQSAPGPETGRRRPCRGNLAFQNVNFNVCLLFHRSNNCSNKSPRFYSLTETSRHLGIFLSAIAKILSRTRKQTAG